MLQNPETYVVLPVAGVITIASIAYTVARGRHDNGLKRHLEEIRVRQGECQECLKDLRDNSAKQVFILEQIRDNLIK